MNFPPLFLFQRWLWSSIATHNDHLELELLMAWEPSNSLRSMFTNIGKKPDIVFLMEMKIDAKQNGAS